MLDFTINDPLRLKILKTINNTMPKSVLNRLNPNSKCCTNMIIPKHPGSTDDKYMCIK